ncbi:MAG: dihydrofolate reductase [Bacteroidota bacterium]
MRINAIVATDKIGTIGKAGEIPWYLPADLKYFKRTTIGHPVIMGRKTFQSIGRPLPRRTNIVLTRDPFFIASGTVVVNSIDEAFTHPALAEAEEVFIIGGGEIYKHTLQITDRIFLTKVNTEISGGDAFFPQLNESEWALISHEQYTADERNPLDFEFQVWERNIKPS